LSFETAYEDYCANLDIGIKLAEISHEQPNANNIIKKLAHTLYNTCNSCVCKRVAVIGERKSTLISSLLGFHFLPTSTKENCTAYAIEITYHKQEQYLILIEYFTLEEWIEQCTEDLQIPKSHKKFNSVKRRLNAVYGNKYPSVSSIVTMLPSAFETSL